MSKIMQIVNGFCHWDATPLFPTLESIKGNFPETDIFVEVPDFVFMGWGYDETKKGDARFIKPTPPDGWLYDDKTGTFYNENELPPNPDYNAMEALENHVVDLEYRVTLMELGVSD